MAQRLVQAVERALTLVETFSFDRRELSLTELARATGYYKSTVLRLMASLENYGYVVRDANGIFRLGAVFARLAPIAGEGPSLENLVRPILLSLLDASGETASFYVRDGDQRICRFRENGRGELRHHLDEGVRLPLRWGAAGRVLNQEAEPNQIVISRGERQQGLSAASVGIYRAKTELLGALALSGPSERFDALIQECHMPLLARHAKLLEQQWPSSLNPV